MHLKKNKKRSQKKYFYYNKTQNGISNYEGSLDLSSIAEWIACGFFLGNKNFTKSEFLEEINYNYESRQLIPIISVFIKKSYYS